MNASKWDFRGVSLMYKRLSALDNFGFLWYHARVKLGCFATALSDLTGRKASQKKILTFAGNGARKRLFPPFRVLDGRSCLACHTYVRAFAMPILGNGGKNFRLKTVKIFALPLRKSALSDCREAGFWRTRRRGSRRISHLWYADGSNIP